MKYVDMNIKPCAYFLNTVEYIYNYRIPTLLRLTPLSIYRVNLFHCILIKYLAHNVLLIVDL
ncbi:hypothetical protein MNBD_CPR01-482 [hydrothermal vent metagenome]|uniref:Uncharacterized protein n=1 Tax=hydrothermal vent metagenome TaxID=652676 RepID=A0A3B0UM17_9ZZZZ